jgi:Ig-like domain CHU_C associated
MATREGCVRFAIVGVLVALCVAPIAKAQKCGPMDVVFVVDNTNTMTEVIAEVQHQVNAIADTVTKSSGGDYQFGLVVAPTNDVNVLLDLSPNNRDALATAVNKMVTVSSCGEPAAWDDGLDTVLHNLAGGRSVGGGNGKQIGSFNGQFRANSTKIIIVISDARPNHTRGCDYVSGVDNVFVHNLAGEAYSREIHLATVFVPTTGADAYGFVDIIKSIMNDMAITSDGMYLSSKPDASDLASIIMTIVESCGMGNGLIVTPAEMVLSNGETGTAKVQNYRPGRDPSTLVYSSSGLTPDSTVKFTSVTPDVAGTDQRSMDITIGPDAFAGPYVLQVNAGHTGLSAVQTAFMVVYVDCVPPMILSAPGNQPANATIKSGSTTTLNVKPSGTSAFRYQWYLGHTGATRFPIAGATSASYTTPALTTSTEYWVRVLNPCGTTDSASAMVTVTP